MSPVAPLAAHAPAPVREKRLVLRVLDLWRQACEGDMPPKLGAVGEDDAGEDAPHIFRIDLLDPAGPRFVSIGAALRIGGWPGQGAALVASCPEHSVLGLVGRCWPEIVERGVPVTRGGVASNDGVAVLYRSIMAPLADEHGKIAGILGAANWRPVS
ncbi:MAG: hypothetical protein ACREFL_02165 [Stellaceae bacterium]